MHVYSLNRPLFHLPEMHPAHRFLKAFIACRHDCVGREIALADECQAAIDQEWYSEVDQRKWTFSDFAYSYLSFDVVLDGWLSSASALTSSEAGVLQSLPRLRVLLDECEVAASRDNNSDVLAMIQQVRSLFDLWEECITLRLRQQCV